MSAEGPIRRRWVSAIFTPYTYQKPKDATTRISLPFIDLNAPSEHRAASLSSDCSKPDLNKEDSESTIVQSESPPSPVVHRLAPQKEEEEDEEAPAVEPLSFSLEDNSNLTPVKHVRDKSLASSFRFGGDEIEIIRPDPPPVPSLPPRIAPLFRNASGFSTQSSATSFRRPLRFDPRDFFQPDDYVRQYKPSHLPHPSTGSSLYSTDTGYWGQMPTFEERYPHHQRPQFPIPRAPWPPVHPLAQSYENIISPMLLNYVGHPTLAAIIDADDTHTSERAYFANHFSDRDTYLDQSERWESLYQGTFESDYAQSDYHSDTGSSITIETSRQSASPAEYVQFNVHDIALSQKGDEDGSDPSNHHPSLRLGIILFSLWFGNLLVALQDTMIPIAIPALSSDIRGLKDVAECLSWYSLAFTLAYPLSYKLYRLFDAKVVYLFAVILFAAGNGLCGAADNSKYLIWCRALAGIGSAALLQGSTSVLELIVTPNDSNGSLIDYIKLVECAYGFAIAIGPVLGGVITDCLGWRWCFWINGILGACLFFLAIVCLRPTTINEGQRKCLITTKLKSLDYPGLISFSGAIVCLLLAVHWAGLEHAWTSVTTIGLMFGFVLLLIVFVFVEWIQEGKTLLPPLTLRREVLWSSLFLFCAYGTNSMLSLYIPFYFQAGQGTSASVSGIRNLPLALPSIGAIVLAVGTSLRARHCVSYILVGQMITAVGLTFFSIQDAKNETGVWLVLLSIKGFGLGITTLFPYFMLSRILDDEHVLTGHLIMTFFSRLGGTIVPTVAQNVFMKNLRDRLDNYLSPTSLAHVMRVGASHLEKLALQANELAFVREVFSIAVSKVTYCGLAVSALGMLCVFVMWLSLFSGRRRHVTERT